VETGEAPKAQPPKPSLAPGDGVGLAARGDAPTRVLTHKKSKVGVPLFFSCCCRLFFSLLLRVRGGMCLFSQAPLVFFLSILHTTSELQTHVMS